MNIFTRKGKIRMIHQNFSREILTLGKTKRAVQRRKGQEMNDLWKTSKTNK